MDGDFNRDLSSWYYSKWVGLRRRRPPVPVSKNRRSAAELAAYITVWHRSIFGKSPNCIFQLAVVRERGQQ